MNEFLLKEWTETETALRLMGKLSWEHFSSKRCFTCLLVHNNTNLIFKADSQ